MSSAKLKETPKKVYKSCSAPSNTCRLCQSVCESKYLKNLYNKSNCQLLTMAETIYSCKLPCDDELPRLICRPCERRLNNFKAFKDGFPVLARSSSQLAASACMSTFSQSQY